VLPDAPTNAGSYSVVAHFHSADPNYTDANSPPTLFSITQRALTITASNENKPYGDTFTPDGSSQFTTGAGQLVNADTLPPVTLTSAGYAATATSTAPGPDYTITASAAVGAGRGNYAI